MKKFTMTLVLNRFLGGIAGNVATLFAMTAPIALLAIGGAVDYSHAITEHQRLQAAIDASVLAGARIVASNSQALGQTAAQAAAVTAAGNYFSSDVSWSGPTAKFSFNANGSLTGTATYSMPTLFGALTSSSNMPLSVTATASVGSGAATYQTCILLLSKTASQSLLANSGTNISAPACQIDVASTANPAAIFNSGGNIQSAEICIAGSNTINNGGTYNNVVKNCTVPANPFVGKLPAPVSTTCSGANANGGNYNGGSVTLSPGVYCGWFNFNNAPSVTLLPGVYVIAQGGWNVNGGSWTGSGVTFYFADTSKIQFNSGMSMTLSAPTTGTYAGILFYEADGLSESAFVFNDSVTESLSGLIYLPSRDVTFNSTSNENTPSITVVANTAIFNALNWSLTPSSSWQIGSSSSAGSGSEARLSN